MLRFLLSLISFCFSMASFSQASDFIRVKKKNNRILKTYFPGSVISCKTVYGNYLAGMVKDVKNDSVFIKEYDIRSNPTMWGVFSVDTMGSYVVGLNYKDIETVDFQQKESFGFVKNGSLFIVGGLGYAALNVINGKYLHQSITGPENRKSLGIALGVAGAGYLVNRVHKFARKKYVIEYVHMKVVPKLRAF